jgi:hypothetical protein
MLHKETKRTFIVYPSWAELSAKWADLPRLLADPLNSGFLPQKFDPARDKGWSQQRYELIDGPEGGGIVVRHRDGTRRAWICELILTREANMLAPNGMEATLMRAPDESPVSYLEPMTRGWQFRGVKKPPNFRPGLSYEHADAAGDIIYWVVRFKRARNSSNKVKGLESVPDWARHFGLEAKRLDSGPPDALRAESDSWFPNREFESAWFEVRGDGDSVGFQFAVLVYVGNHLRWVGGPRVISIHLVAQIEGRPSICQDWSRVN